MFSLPPERHRKGRLVGAVVPALLLVQVQRGMPTSVQSAVTTRQDITMASGRVKDVKPFLKEAFKVQSVVSCCFNFTLSLSNSFADDPAEVSLISCLAHKVCDERFRGSWGFEGEVGGGVDCFKCRALYLNYRSLPQNPRPQMGLALPYSSLSS